MRLEDRYFFYTYLSPIDSGLSIDTYVSMHLTHKRPTLLVGKYGRKAAVLINDKPKILRGSLDDEIKIEIFEWIIINKKYCLNIGAKEFQQ